MLGQKSSGEFNFAFKKLMTSHKNLTFFEVSLLYIYICFIMTRIFNVPEIIKATLAFPTFFLLPLLVGVWLVTFIKVWLKTKVFNNVISENISYFIVCLLTGIFFIELIGVISQILHFNLLLKNIGYLILFIATLGMTHLRVAIHEITNAYIWPSVKKHIIPISFMLFLSIMPFLMKILFVPPPLTTWSSWSNPISHVQAVLRLLNSGFFDVTQRWMEIILTAVSCQLFNISCPEFFSYAGTLLVTAMLSLGTYALTYRLSSKIFVSSLSGAISIFLNAPIGFQEIPAYHFKSNTLLISLYPWVLLLVIDLLNKRKVNKLRDIMSLVIPIGVFFLGLAFLSGSRVINMLYSCGISYEIQRALIRPLVIMLPPLALIIYALTTNRLKDLAILLLAATVLYTTNEADFIAYISSILLFIFLFYMIDKEKRGRILIRVVSLVVFTIVFLAWNNIITLSDLPISSLIGYSQPLKLNSFLVKKIVFSDGNSLITRYFFIFGLIILMFFREERYLLALGALTITFSLYFFPDYWTLRILGATTPFIAFAISNNLNLTSKIVNSTFARHKKIKVVTKCILAGLFIIVITPNLLNPIYTKFSRFPGSRLTSYEYDVAIWLRENTKETEVIVSDYWTMMLLNPLSNKIWLTDRQFMANALDLEYKYLLEELKDEVFKASNSSEAYKKIQFMIKKMRNGIDWTERYYCDYVGINTENIIFLIVLSSRTVKWLETEDMDVMEPQYSGVDPRYLAVFNNTRYFEKLIQISDQIYVFKVVNNGA